MPLELKPGGKPRSVNDVAALLGDVDAAREGGTLVVDVADREALYQAMEGR